MSRPSIDVPLPPTALRVVPWPDAVIELLGYDARSPYVERFWLAFLGPTTTLLLRHVAGRFDDAPDGFDLDIADTAKALGLGAKAGENGPFHRAIARTVHLRMAQSVERGVLAVRTRIPPLTRSQIERLPEPLQGQHQRWMTAQVAQPDVAERRRRARRLALSLLELGETDEAIERQLHTWKYHPAMAHEALAWAHARRDGVGASTSDRSASPDAAPGSERRATRALAIAPARPAVGRPAAALSAAAGPIGAGLPRSASGRPIPPPPGHVRRVRPNAPPPSAEGPEGDAA